MTSMTVAILLLGVTGALAYSRPVVPGNALAPLWSDLRVHYSPNGESEGYFQLPRTVADAIRLKYTCPREEAGSDLEPMCPDRDPSVCVFFDREGNIAGMDIGVLRSDVENNNYPYENHPMFVPKTRFGYNTYITRLFFAEPKTLPFNTRRNLAREGTGTGLWLQMGKSRQQQFKIPRREADIARTAYVRESCVPGMGLHYYYNITTSMDCQDFEPIFGLFRNSEMIGFGFKTFGTATPISKAWFEDFPVAALRATIPNAPQCLIDNTMNYGLISMHVFFVDQPWAIQCPA